MFLQKSKPIGVPASHLSEALNTWHSDPMVAFKFPLTCRFIYKATENASSWHSGRMIALRFLWNSRNIFKLPRMPTRGIPIA